MLADVPEYLCKVFGHLSRPQGSLPIREPPVALARIVGSAHQALPYDGLEGEVVPAERQENKVVGVIQEVELRFMPPSVGVKVVERHSATTSSRINRYLSSRVAGANDARKMLRVIV